MFTKEDERRYVNIVKGIAVFLMLWGHAIQFGMVGSALDFYENSVFQVIYSFHMPLFMLVSGYLFFYSFQKRDLEALIVHRTKPLLHTILCFSIFYYYATVGFANILQGNFDVLFDGKWLNYLGHLWFLWSILSASVIVAVVCKKVHSALGQILLIAGLSFVVLLFPNAALNLYMYPYFIAGFFFAKCKNRMPRKVLFLKYPAALSFPIIAGFFEKKHFIYTTGLMGTQYSAGEYLAIDMYRWLVGFLGSVFVLVIVELVYLHLRERKCFALLLKGLEKMGSCSLQIYALSTVFLSIYLPSVLIRLPDLVDCWTQSGFLYSYIVAFTIALFYAVALTGMCKLLDRFKLGKLLFGR